MAMLKVVFTLDYEIHGNGEGSPYSLMVEPTQRLMDLFDNYGAKLTILADVSEILKFKEYFDEHGRDDYHYAEIIEQLRYALINGHDVQLHIHSSYTNSRLEKGKWCQDWSEYSLSELKYGRINEIIGVGKAFLEKELRVVKPDYKCFVFRAANWSMSPSLNICKALVENGIEIDTSVFKYGKRSGRVSFDYREAFSDTLPWPISVNNVCFRDPGGKLVEFPIYCENRQITSFLTPNRLFRVIQASFHKHKTYKLEGDSTTGNPSVKKGMLLKKVLTMILEKHAWKLDFNQCSGKQLVSGLKRIEKKYNNCEIDIPVVLIGHSKLFTKWNRKTLEPFLKYIARSPEKYMFASFGQFDLVNTYNCSLDN